jgi:hypothetical protein
MEQIEITFESQCRMILKHLSNGFTITQREASKLYGCDRLGARIYDLRNGAYSHPVTPIKTTMIRSGRKRFAEYAIEK